MPTTVHWRGGSSQVRRDGQKKRKKGESGERESTVYHRPGAGEDEGERDVMRSRGREWVLHHHSSVRKSPGPGGGEGRDGKAILVKGIVHFSSTARRWTERRDGKAEWQCVSPLLYTDKPRSK